MNLLASTEIAGVFLDPDLHIKRFAPATLRLLNLLPGDLGRPFADIQPRLEDAVLLDDCRKLVRHLATLEATVRDGAGHLYLRA